MADKRRKRRVRKFTRRMQIKLLAIFAFVLLFLIILLVRIMYINIHSGKTYAKQVLSQENYDSQTLVSRRGEIQDTNGRTLAYSEKVYNVVMDCVEINLNEDYIDPTVEAVAEVFGLDRGVVRDRIVSEKTCDSRYQVVKEKISEEEKDAFDDYKAITEEKLKGLSDEEKEDLITKLNNIRGVWFEEKFVRNYPLGSLASNVVGFSNEMGDGINGLEAYYDSQLKGTNGRVFGYLNQQEEFEKKTIPPENGYTLQTTLDVNIQSAVEDVIAGFDDLYGDDHDDGTSKHGAKNIGVIVMNPNSGSVLAMATNSGYDLNHPQDLTAWYTESEIKAMPEEEYVEKLNEMWNNYCVSQEYEPGSTFKPITVSSALECGAVTRNDGFYCDGGEFITDTEIHCDAYPYSHGDESLGDALKNSCNDALMQIGMKMGITRFLKYQSLYNFGKRTGIDLPNESTGTVYNRESMNEVELATCTFGQGITCTMIQEMTAFCAVVNGGYYYQPHVVDKIINEKGKVVKNSANLLLKQTVSSDVSEDLRSYLEVAVQEGTGRSAQVPGYRIGGKTGTAEKIDPTTGKRAKGKYLVSFIGAAPINDPEVVIYVVVDEPNVAEQANSIYAQDIFRKTAMQVLPYMGIYPTEEVSAAQLEELGLTRDDVVEEKSVETFQAFDSYGNLYSSARVENGKVVNGAGSEIAGAYIDTDGTVYDGYMNPVSKVVIVETEPPIDPKVDNPNIAIPPSDNGEDDSNTTVWDGTALDEETKVE